MLNTALFCLLQVENSFFFLEYNDLVVFGKHQTYYSLYLYSFLPWKRFLYLQTGPCLPINAWSIWNKQCYWSDLIWWERWQLAELQRNIHQYNLELPIECGAHDPNAINTFAPMQNLSNPSSTSRWSFQPKKLVIFKSTLGSSSTSGCGTRWKQFPIA